MKKRWEITFSVLAIIAFLMAGFSVYNILFIEKDQAENPDINIQNLSKEDYGKEDFQAILKDMDPATLQKMKEQYTSSMDKSTAKTATTDKKSGARGTFMGNLKNMSPDNEKLQENLSKLQLIYTVGMEDTGDYIELLGTLEADTRDVASKVHGETVEIYVEKGQEVSAGQELALIDDLDYRINYIQTLNDYENAVNQGDRILELKKLQLDVAKKDLENTVIKSPVTGVISQVSLNVGDSTNENSVAFIVVDISSMVVTAAVDEIDFNKIQKNMRAIISFNNLDIEIEGALNYIDPVAVNSGGIVLIPIEIKLNENPVEKGIVPGMTCNIKLIIMDLDNAIVIPLEGLYSDPKGNSYVLKQTDKGQEERVAVTTGEKSEDRVEITSGLEFGDTIILKPDQSELERLELQNSQPNYGGKTVKK